MNALYVFVMVLKTRSNPFSEDVYLLPSPRRNLFTCDIILRDNARNGMDEYTWNSFTLSSRSYSHETRGKSIWRCPVPCTIASSTNAALDDQVIQRSIGDILFHSVQRHQRQYKSMQSNLGAPRKSEMFMIKVEKVFGCRTMFGITNVALIDLIF